MTNQLATNTAKNDIVAQVEKKVKAFKDNGEIQFPAGYSPENAMKSAWLILQETKDRNGKVVLESCTKASVANSLLDMVVQGLNPAKKQGYFIAYGPTLTFQRSYFGTMAVTKRLTGAKSIDAMTIHEGDKVSYEIIDGRYANLKHEQAFGSTDKKIIGAYCTITEADGTLYTEIMTEEEVKKSWAQSKANPSSPTSVHSKFPIEMTKKTVTNRACKRFLNSSDDTSLFAQTVALSDEKAYTLETRQEIEENSNQELIDFDETESAAPEAELVEVGDGRLADASTGEIVKMSVHAPGEEDVSGDDGAGF